MKAADLTLMQKAGLFVLLLGASPWRAWVLAKLWFWFFVPIGAPAIGPALAYGISTLITLFRAQWTGDDVWDRVDHKIGFAYLTPGLFLFVGWITHLLVIR